MDRADGDDSVGERDYLMRSESCWSGTLVGEPSRRRASADLAQIARRFSAAENPIAAPRFGWGTVGRPVQVVGVVEDIGSICRPR